MITLLQSRHILWIEMSQVKQVFQTPKNIKCLVKNITELVAETALQNVRGCLEYAGGLFGLKKRKINLEYCTDVKSSLQWICKLQMVIVGD